MKGALQRSIIPEISYNLELENGNDLSTMRITMRKLIFVPNKTRGAHICGWGLSWWP